MVAFSVQICLCIETFMVLWIDSARLNRLKTNQPFLHRFRNKISIKMYLPRMIMHQINVKSYWKKRHHHHQYHRHDHHIAFRNVYDTLFHFQRSIRKYTFSCFSLITRIVSLFFLFISFFLSLLVSIFFCSPATLEFNDLNVKWKRISLFLVNELSQNDPVLKRAKEKKEIQSNSATSKNERLDYDSKMVKFYGYCWVMTPHSASSRFSLFLLFINNGLSLQT